MRTSAFRALAVLGLAVAPPRLAAQPLPAHDSMQGRAPGTEGSLKSRAFLERALAETGARPAFPGYRQAFAWDGGQGVNFVAVVPGRRDTTDVIVLTAHYDHVGVREGLIY